MRIKWGNRQWETYKPKVNRKKQTILLLSFIPFFFTVGTNWMYFAGLKILSKVNPLWVYQ